MKKVSLLIGLFISSVAFGSVFFTNTELASAAGGGNQFLAR